MKRALLLLGVFNALLISPCYPQGGIWTWMKGDGQVNSLGSFGTQGVADPANNPPGLYGAAEWKDLQGNFWIFGGTTGNNYSALWKHDPLSNMWTWMKSPSSIDQQGTYGTLGIPSPSNNPGARGFGFVNWIDTAGNLWLFGGAGFDDFGTIGSLDDLWRYEIAANEWTWMGGFKTVDHIPNYGTIQVPSATNDPGSRTEVTTCWTDSAGNFWFYSGLDFAYNSKADVWKYDYGLANWVWMSGSNTTSTVVPLYGPPGVFSPSYTPGSRLGYCKWNGLDGKFWMFGGNAGPVYSDLWVYDPFINQWAWMGGSQQTNSNNEHGPYCNLDTIYYPKGRGENRASWTDLAGNLWLFGGSREPSPGTETMNDLWVYAPSTNQWTFVSGDSTYNKPGVYGTQGVPDPANVAGARQGAVGWMSDDCALWLFGGSRGSWDDAYNDLWRFQPDTVCIPVFSCSQQQQPSLALSVSDTFICEKFCIDFFDQSLNNPSSWLWQFLGGIPSSSTDENPVNICYDVPGVYDVILIVNGTDTLLMADFITVYPTPPFPTITQNGNTLTSSPAVSYQWQYNSIDIGGATNQSYTATDTGYYTIIVRDSAGCQNSLTIFVEVTGVEDIIAGSSISIHPNPSDGNFMIELSGRTENVVMNLQIKLYNMLGQVVFSEEEKISGSGFTKHIELSHLPPAIYFLELSLGKSANTISDERLTTKLIITK